MPNPKKYKKKSEWMSACVSTAVEEGRDQKQAVAMCISMWNNRNKKSKDEIEDERWEVFSQDRTCSQS